MRNNRNNLGYILLIISLLAVSACAQKDKKISRELSTKILADNRFDQVEQMAEQLVEDGLTAGDSYGEVWIRDLNSFIELSVAVNGQERPSEALLTFFKFQSEDGNIPDGYIPIESGHGGYKYIFSDFATEYKAHKNTVETDQESSLIQAIYKYIEATGDQDFLQKSINGKSVKERMGNALQYLINHRMDNQYGLLWGATTVDWGDVQPEHNWGVELDSLSHPAIDIYDNAMFVIAVKNYISLIEDKSEKAYWTSVTQNITQNVRKYLWDEKNQKYIPHIYLEKGSPFPVDFDENKIYYHGGTFMAIEAGFLTRDEIRITYQKMQQNVRESGAPTIGLTVYPPYPNGFFLNPGLYEYGYQNGGDWTWFGGRMVQQLIRHGMYEEAYESISPMLDLVIKHDGFYEWWTREGEPAGSGSFRGAAGVLWKSIQLFRENME
ncbi:MAG: hypothetical protein PHV53_07275 [Fermentimonas sp.]|nr:hypothetical protein [Fermentimonas sp.]